jgi:hypothetical protein
MDMQVPLQNALSASLLHPMRLVSHSLLSLLRIVTRKSALPTTPLLFSTLRLRRSILSRRFPYATEYESVRTPPCLFQKTQKKA